MSSLNNTYLYTLFAADRVSLPEQTSGVFIIKADGGGGYQLEVPFEVSVLHG